MTRSFTRAGSVVLTERSSALPVVGFGVSLRTGTLHDPRGQEGLTVLMSRAQRMGPAHLSAHELEVTLDELGAQLGISASQSYLHVGGVVVAHNLPRFVELVAEITLRPAFRPRDVQQAKREMLADLDALSDDDRTLCFRHFRSFAFGNHLYGRPRGGSKQSVSALGRSQLVEHHARMMFAGNFVFAAWGDFRPRELQALLDRGFGALPERTPPALSVPEPQLARGRRILVVDKPERTQAQLAIGTLGTSAHDRDHVPLVVGNTAFGGLFSSRLNDEVRVRRGLSYGAGSNFTLSRGRDLWSMYTAPAAKDLRRCLELQLALYDRWVARGVTARELAASKRYLVKSHAFEIDTAAKRLDQRLDVELLGFPKAHHDGFVRRVQATTRDEVGRALGHRLSRRDQTMTLVATAAEVVPELERVEGVETIAVVPFDRV